MGENVCSCKNVKQTEGVKSMVFRFNIYFIKCIYLQKKKETNFFEVLNIKDII